MANILVGWELGFGLGQVVPLRDIARRLAALGHQPQLVFNNVVDPAALFAPGEFRMLQAPSWLPRRSRLGGDVNAATYADVLALAGFNSVASIATIVQAWDELLDLTAPDLVVGNASPALWLAARGQIPTIALGNGFAMPPSELAYLPPLQPDAHPTVRQADLVGAINQIQTNRGRPTLPNLPALFDADAKYILTLPTLDPYADHRPSPADGPLSPYGGPLPMPPSDSVFAHFDADQPGLGVIMEGLALAGLTTNAFIRGAPPSAVERYAQDNISIVEDVPDFGAAIRDCSVVVHDGGLHTASVALSLGRPQVILPRGLERRLTAQRVHDLGTGIKIEGRISAPHFATILAGAANSGRMARRAFEVATDLSRAEPRDVLSEIVETCEELVAV